jgi:hypothetical protein
VVQFQLGDDPTTGQMQTLFIVFSATSPAKPLIP